jgi:hypothetical protein
MFALAQTSAPFMICRQRPGRLTFDRNLEDLQNFCEIAASFPLLGHYNIEIIFQEGGQGDLTVDD